MSKLLDNVVRLVFCVCLLATIDASACLASTLKVTEGRIDERNHGEGYDISLFGYDCNSLPFVFNAYANSVINHPSGGYHDPGTNVSPTFKGSGLDLRAFSLSIDGNDVPLRQGYEFGPGSIIEASGPALTLPDPGATQTFEGPIDFDLEFNIYRLGTSSFASPDYAISETGTGFVDILAILRLDAGPPYYEIINVNYLLGPMAGPRQVPEPSNLLIWTGLGLIRCIRSNRRNPSP